MKTAALFLLFVVSASALGDDECRVRLHEIYQDSEKYLVKIEDVSATSHSECQSEAIARKLDSEKKEGILEVRVYFSYREPAIERP